MVRREKSNYTIQSVSHALDVLEQFSGESDELGVTELSKRLKLHKNNVFRLLATLEARGYIEQNKATENYRLGVRCLRLGQRFVSQLGLLRQARPVMRALAQGSRETAIIAVVRNGAIVPLDAVETEQAVRLVSRIGDTQPLHCTAVGKLYLALGDEVLRNSLPDALEKYTEKTIVDRGVLNNQLNKISEHGYAVEIGEHVEDVRAVAVPIRDYTRTVVGSLALAGPGYRLSQERIEKEIVPLIVKAGRDLSSRLGYDEA
jgi:DNA-binding IclR family transcriptional regulator